MQKNRNVKALRGLFALMTLSLISVGCDFNKEEKKTEAPPAAAESAPAPVVPPAPTASGSPATSAAGAPAAGEKPGANTAAVDLATDADGLSKAVVTMETTKGVIKYKFYPKDAPKTSKRIAELIQSGFYNGLTFHRVVPGFVIQGGDPQGTGMGGSGTKLPAEFNSRKHVLGAVAMARSQDPNSADSQFYIALGDLPSLDNQYTVFGKVIEGIDIVQKIQVGDKMTKVTVK